MRPWTLLSILLLAACGSRDIAPAESRTLEDWQQQISMVNDLLLNDGDVERIPEYFSESYVPPGGGWRVGGHGVIRGFIRALRTAFPDLHVEVHVLVAQGDRVAWVRTNRGTHEGELMGVPGSGRVLTWQDMIVTQYEGNKVAMEWGVSGLAGVLRAQ